VSKVQRSAAIGVFDSGIGGLSVVREIIRELPCENIVYYGDTARLPYGSKTPTTIREFALQNAVFLNSRHVKAIVIACSTASSIATEYLRNFMKLPVIGVIEGGARGAVAATHNKRVGVIGTKTTIRSHAFADAIAKLDPGIEVLEAATPLLVHLVEENWIEKDVTCEILCEYLDPLLKAGIDTLVLGCTHYPYLVERLREIAPNTTLVNAAVETAGDVRRALEKRDLLRVEEPVPRLDIYLSDLHPDAEYLAELFLGRKVAIKLPETCPEGPERL